MAPPALAPAPGSRALAARPLIRVQAAERGQRMSITVIEYGQSRSYSLRSLALRARMSHSGLSLLFSGQRKGAHETISRIAGAMAISSDALGDFLKRRRAARLSR